MQPNQEWFTIQEIADFYKVSYSKIRQSVAVLSNAKQITVREKPSDNRIVEVHRDSIKSVLVGAGMAASS